MMSDGYVNIPIHTLFNPYLHVFLTTTILIVFLPQMTERSDINANIAQMNKAATAAAVGLKPSTNKKPVFK